MRHLVFACSSSLVGALAFGPGCGSTVDVASAIGSDPTNGPDADRGTAPDTSTSREPGTGGGDIARPVPDGWCTTDGDCRVVNDDCQCVSVPRDQADPNCNTGPGPTDVCSIYDDPEPVRAQCIAGRCSVGLTCDGFAACLRAVPECPGNRVPPMLASRSCWAGPCIEKAQCAGFQSCDACEAGETCVYDKETSPAFHCVPNPPACEGAETNCACAEDFVCRPDQRCSDDGPSRVQCFVPVEF